MVKPRTKGELELMRESGRISAIALKKVIESIQEGATGLEIDAIATKEILKNGGKIAFTNVDGYKYATCITINEQVVHGIPTDLKFKSGDIVSIDLGCTYNGWYSDTAWSVLVKGIGDKKQGTEEKEKFLRVGEEALWFAIKQAISGNTIGDISHQIQSKIEGNGYSVVKSLVGHGVGRQLHEEPEVPGIGNPGKGLVLQKDVTLAIEAIYTQGSPEVIVEDDSWTISTKDGSWGGLYEMTVIVGNGNPEVLTDWRKV